MDRKIFTREIWEPGKGEYLVEIENPEGIPVDTPCGKRKAVLIKVGNEPYVWLIDHHKILEKEIETRIGNIPTKKEPVRKHVKVIVEGAKEKKTYRIKEIGNQRESLVVSFGIYVSNSKGEKCHLIHSDVIQIGGEK